MKKEVSQKDNCRWPLLWTLVAVGICALASSALIACGSQRSKGQSNTPSAAAEDSPAKVSNQSAPDQTTPQPAAAIDFALQDLSGKPVKLSGYRGKIVLVNFWATWCGPCRFEIPVFVKLKRQYQKRGFEVIGISMDEGSQEEVAEFARQYEINYPVVIGAFAKLDAFGTIKALPTSFVIDRDGRIHSRHQGLLGLNEIENELPKLLAAK
jgi:peroxiredoxin